MAVDRRRQAEIELARFVENIRILAVPSPAPAPTPAQTDDSAKRLDVSMRYALPWHVGARLTAPEDTQYGTKRHAGRVPVKTCYGMIVFSMVEEEDAEFVVSCVNSFGVIPK